MEIIFKDLVELARSRSASYPAIVAYTFLEDGEKKATSITYQEFDLRCRALAVALREQVNPGDRVLLLYPPGLEYIIAFFGCLYAGVVPVPAYPPDTRNFLRLQNIVEDAGAALALSLVSVIANVEKGPLSEAQNLHYKSNGSTAKIRWMASDDLSTDLACRWSDPGITPDTIAFLQYTSGSTGKPKGVIVTHENLIYNSALIARSCQHQPGDCVVSWLPPYHDMGLIAGIIQCMYAGIPGVLMAPMAFLKRPFKWLKAISDVVVEGKITSGAPNFAYELCMERITPEQMTQLNLSKWKIAYSGAEPVRAETMERFAEMFAGAGFRKESFYPVYGLAEATLLASAGDIYSLPVVNAFDARQIEKNKVSLAEEGAFAYSLAGCGENLYGQELLIVEPDTCKLCLPGEIGEIWMAGPSIAKGYWNNEAETAKAFQAYLADSGKGPYLRTGDLGFIKEGELYVTGRLKDLIIIRGVNHYPQDIEATVASASEVLRPGCGAAFSIDKNGEERLVIVQEVKRQYANRLDAEAVIADIVKAVSSGHSLQVYAIVLIEPSSFPKTSSGKLQRSASKKMFLDDTLKVVAQWRVMTPAHAENVV